jgi:hypothetical protein
VTIKFGLRSGDNASNTRGRLAAAGDDETERKQRSMRESLLMTLGSVLIFIESVSTWGVDCFVPFKNG